MQELDISNKNCTVEKDGNVLIVTLNRPEAKNALSPAMLVGMYRAWRLLDEDDDLMCAIFTGKGDTFCAGMDLKQGPEGGEDEDTKMIQELMKDVPDLHWQALLRHNQPMKPIILAVEGYALAGGTEMLQGTDIRVGAQDAIFGVTEAKRGLFPLGGSSVRLRRQIPYCQAAEILLTARHVTAQEAKDIGLINHVVPKGDTMVKAREIADTICKNGPLSIKALMKMLREVDGSIIESDALETELEVGGPIFATEDAREGMKAFKEKREPVYQGK
ncbi:MAG: crotonase/enoyl-CoA hydratase family protein [Pseudomonadota bacterium]